MKARITPLFVAISVLAGLTSCWGQSNKYVSTFETVWNKLNDTYYDTTFGGLSWKAVHDRYLPQIAAVQKDDEFYRLVNRMLWELKVSHANLIPPGLLSRHEPLVCAEGSPGFDLRVLKGVAVITSVTPGSPAHEAGLRPGTVIHAVDGIPVEQIVREAETAVRPPDNDRGRIARVTKAVLGRIYGKPGTEVLVAYSVEGGEKSEKRLLRAKRPGVALGPNGILYLAVQFEARRLESGIGYIRVNTLQPPLATRISSAIVSMGNIRGLVLDLRGNAGGEIEQMPDLFLKERTCVYLKRSRNGETKVYCNPAQKVFEGPLVLLIDQLSGSASELLAGCLQAIGRAVVVGERSPGAVMESDMSVLPDGAILMYPVAQLATPDGTVLEGRGVVPDVEVGLDRALLRKGVDSQLETAVSLPCFGPGMTAVTDTAGWWRRARHDLSRLGPRSSSGP
jgi:carboxyl-terminal processing protease